MWGGVAVDLDICLFVAAWLRNACRHMFVLGIGIAACELPQDQMGRD